MAEEITYDQIETGGPGPGDPLGLRKKLQSGGVANKATGDALGLRAQLNSIKQPVAKTEQPAFKPATDWLNIQQQGYTPIVADNVVNEHTIKTGEAAKRVKEHLLDIDNSVRNLIYDRKKDLEGRIIGEQLGLNPKELDPVNPQAQQLSSMLRQGIPVNQKEIDDFKNAMGGNQLLMRQGLAQKAKDLEESDPIKAKQLKGDIYRLDRQNNPEKDSKIDDNIKKINDGDYDYDISNGVLTKPVGFFTGIVEGFKQKNKAFNDYEVYSNGKEDEIINHLNKKINGDPDDPMVVGTGGFANVIPGGEAGMAVGGQPLKPLAGGALAGWIGGPQAGAASAALISGPEMYKLGYANALPQNYAEIKNQNPGISDQQAYHKAHELADKQATVDAATGIAMGALGGEFAFKPTGLGANLLRKSVGSALKQIGEEGAKKALEGLGVGAIGGAGQVVKNLMSQRAGLKTDTDIGVMDQLRMGVSMTLGMTIAAKLPGLLKPKTYNQLLQSLKSVPTDEMIAYVNSLEKSGMLSSEEGKSLQNSIDEHKALDNSIRSEVPESDRLMVQELIKKRNELEASLEVEDKAYHADTKEKIKALNDRINSISKGEERGELQKLIDEEHKSGNIQGYVTETLRNASEGDLKRYFKEISEQAHDPNSEHATIATFGENIVNKAKELFPKEEPVPTKESKISVIQPGEIKHPETITIKPEENAIPIRSSEEVHVGETPRNSQEVGGGIPESGEAPGSQETGIPKEEGSTPSQEGVDHPTVLPGAVNVYVERPPTQLSFRGLQDTANEFGYEDVTSRDRKTDIQTRSNAEKTANEWASKGEYRSKVDEMLDKIDKKQMVPTDEQRLILEQDLANQKQILRDTPKSSPEYDAQFSKVKRLKEIGNTARSEAGAALRLPEGGSRPHPITDEVDAMVAKAEANAVDKLTDQQKAEVESQVEKYRQASEEANKKIADLEDQVAKLDAQKEFDKAKSTTKRATKKTASERLAFRRSEIEAAREALRKLRSGESGLSAVPLPGVRELMAIAPHVKNIMVDLVAQGVDNLQDVISHLHAEFKDVLEGLTEKNIHDIIAGEYNEPGRPLSELQRQVKDLQDEAKLINQIEALENGVEPKNEKAKRERNQKIKDLRDKIKELKATDGADELRAIKKRNEEQVKKINEKIAKGQFGKESKKSIFDREDVKQKHPQLRKEALDAIAKKEEAQHEFDLALFNDEMNRRKWYQKAGSFAGKLIHTSKAVMSGIDDSAVFVQNGWAALINPKIGAKAWWNHAKDAFSNARFKRELAALHQRSDWEIIKKSGLEIVEPHSAASKQVEEAFEQNLLAQLEIKGIKPWDYTGGVFERAFTSMGNNMRLLLFEKRMAELKDAKMTFESHPQEYKDAARVINELTGRGKLPAGLAQASPYITPFIWAPRMLASTLNTLGLGEVRALGGKGYYQNLTPMQRRFALGQLGRGIGMGVAVMGAAAFGGAKVDYDPRSVTFGDIIIGDHHYNVFGRYTPVVKVLVQFGMGTRIKGGGEVQDLDSGKFGAKTRSDVVTGFFRGKLTPAFATAWNLADHRNYFTNEPFHLKDVPSALLQPMSIKELRDGWKNDGSMTILNRFLPAFEGMKTSDERDFNKKGGSGGGAGATGSIGGHKTTAHKTSHNTHKTR